GRFGFRGVCHLWRQQSGPPYCVHHAARLPGHQRRAEGGRTGSTDLVKLTPANRRCNMSRSRSGRFSLGHLLLNRHPRRSGPRKVAPLRLEALEDRLALATFLVTNANDSDVSSLRQAILDSNATSEANTINFNIDGGGLQTISLLSALPAITN